MGKGSSQGKCIMAEIMAEMRVVCSRTQVERLLGIAKQRASLEGTNTKRKGERNNRYSQGHIKYGFYSR